MLRIFLIGLPAISAFLALTTGCNRGPTVNETPEVLELKLGYVMAPQGAAHEAAEEFANRVKQKTGGRVSVKLYHSASLGTDRQLTEGLLLGTVDIVLSGFASIVGFIPEYEALESPFAFRDYEHLDRVVYGRIGREASDLLKQRKGIEILAWWPRGPRYMTANKPIRYPAELKGMKLRVPELPIYIETWKCLGANTTPITYSEMFMALKQGVVEGQENPLEVIYTAGLYDVQKYVIETRHLIACYQLMIGRPALGKLSAADRTALREAALEVGEFEKKRMLELEAEYVLKLKEKGMTFVAVDDIAAFRDPVAAHLPVKFKDRWAPALYERIVETE
jgi:tripartite ATP-independent transporter DctP family solute receptor